MTLKQQQQQQQQRRQQQQQQHQHQHQQQHNNNTNNFCISCPAGGSVSFEISGNEYIEFSLDWIAKWQNLSVGTKHHTKIIIAGHL